MIWNSNEDCEKYDSKYQKKIWKNRSSTGDWYAREEEEE